MLVLQQTMMSYVEPVDIPEYMGFSPDQVHEYHVCTNAIVFDQAMLTYEAKLRFTLSTWWTLEYNWKDVVCESIFGIDAIEKVINEEIDATAAKKGVTYKYLLKNCSSDNETAFETIILKTDIEGTIQLW